MLKKLKIATRKSPLALWQANHVKNLIESLDTSISVELVKITTQGDKILDKPLNDIGGKGLFLKELEESILIGNTDIAVHSMKDIPASMHEDLEISAILKREDARDILISKKYKSLEEFPAKSFIGTSSVRRICFINSLYPGIGIKNIRGNVDTRIAKLNNLNLDGLILAAAGVHRLNLNKDIAMYFNIDNWVPAIGQGAIGIQIKRGSKDLKKLISNLNHSHTSICVNIERQVSKYFDADCSTPLGAFASIHDDKIKLNAMIGNPTNNKIVYDKLEFPIKEHKNSGTLLAEKLSRKYMSIK